MATNQDRFLARIDAIAREYDLDVRTHATYANTGTVYVHRDANDFRAPLLTFSYNFQREYVTFTGLPAHLSYVTYESGLLVDTLECIEDLFAETIGVEQAFGS